MKRLITLAVLALASFSAFADLPPGPPPPPPPPPPGSSAPAQDPATAVKPPAVYLRSPNLRTSSVVAQGKRFSIRAAAQLGPHVTDSLGGSVSGGWQLNSFVGVDVRFSYASLHYSAIAVSPSPPDVSAASAFAASTDPQSEYNRFRADSDPWSALRYGAGISATGRLSSEWIPLLSERVRFGLGSGQYTDQKNSVGFTAGLLEMELTAFYQMGRYSPWTIDGTCNFTWGTLSSSLAGQLGRLPTSALSLSFGLTYWL